jgi:NADP-dependent 3-hydroxy acid dehydrogenase YdfG
MTVLITGATSGIGLALCKTFANSNFNVIACGRNQAILDQLASEYEQITPLCFDITDKQKVKEISEQIPDLEVLIFNAGSCEYVDDVLAFDSDLFSRVITTNLISLSYGLEYWLPKVKRNGQLGFVSSSAHLMPFPRAEAYGASKAAVSYLAKSLRLDLIEHNIGVSLIEPGFVKTPLTDKNNFDMPFIINADQAADEIYNGLAAKKQLIRFPHRLTGLLRLFSWLPSGIWQKLILKGQS